MSALDEIREKELHERTKTEKCIIEVWNIHGFEWMAEAAAREQADKAAELLALRERVEKMAVILQWIYDDGEGGTYRPDIQAVLVAHNNEGKAENV